MGQEGPAEPGSVVQVAVPATEIMIVDADTTSAVRLRGILESHGFAVTAWRRAEDAAHAIGWRMPDAIFAGLPQDVEAARQLVGRIRLCAARVPLIALITPGTDPHICAQLGCAESLERPVRAEQALASLVRALATGAAGRSFERAAPPALAGTSTAARRLRDLIERVAPLRMTALIVGEPGTGAEALARRIHALSRRRHGRFIPVRCASREPSALELELLGSGGSGGNGALHAARRGLFEEAHHGSLFLDEVSALPLDLQAHTLGILHDRRVRRLDSDQEVEADVRLIAATSVNLAHAVEAGTFNWGLYLRLNVFPIVVPALRERPEDVPAIADAVRARFATENDVEPPQIPKRVQHRLMEYDWPGNVEELEHYIERALIVYAGRAIIEFDPPLASITDLPKHWRPPLQDWTLDRLEREYIAWVLRRAGGHQGEAARVLGISRRTLYRRLRDDEKGFRGSADVPLLAPAPELADDESPDPDVDGEARRSAAGARRGHSPRTEASPG